MLRVTGLDAQQKEGLYLQSKCGLYTSKDFNGLRHLRDTVPAQFKRGVLLYTGEQVVSFDEQMTAVPIGLLL